ncbi:MAG: helix-turn-helix domain-containing protein [Gemmataceae bacterium]
MNSVPLSRRFGDNLRTIREARGVSQEALAAKAGLHRTHVSLIERNKRVVRLDTVERLAIALDVELSELFVAQPSRRRSDSRVNLSDRDELERLIPYIREFQTLALRHGIADVFQDNGGKLLQTLLVLGLRNLPGREGNDACDDEGNEYELKSVNVRLTQSFSTHHHLNPIILAKYRAVRAWYFSVYEHIELTAIYRMMPAQLEPYFAAWQRRWEENRRDINNPKIPVRFVRTHGQCVFERPEGS